jgi:hypothetical protein
MPDGDDEPRSDEHHDGAGFDDLGRIREFGVFDVPAGAQHEERHVGVLLDLRPVRRRERVFHGQLVQAEHGGDVGHRLFVGLVQAEPDERAVLVPGALQRFSVVLGLAGLAYAVEVDGAVHDGHPVDVWLRRPFGVVVGVDDPSDDSAQRRRPQRTASGPVVLVALGHSHILPFPHRLGPCASSTIHDQGRRGRP